MLSRNLILVMLLASALVGECAAQRTQNKKEESPRFTSRSELVLVPVVVRGKDGKPVTELKPEDFTILDNGKPQPLSTFEPSAAVEPPLPPPPSAQNEFSNAGQEPPRLFTIIALDPIDTRFEDVVAARDAALRYLDHAIRADERIAVISLTRGSFRVIHDFSQNPAVLRKAIEKARLQWGLEPLGTEESLESAGRVTSAADVEATLAGISEGLSAARSVGSPEEPSNTIADSMRDIARAFGPIPGRKALIWVTDGFQFRMDRPVLAGPSMSAEWGRGTRTDIWEAAFRALNDANVAVYPVHAAGLAVFVQLGLRGGQTAGAVKEHNERIEAMNWVAHETGGRMYINSNDILHSIERAGADSGSAYMLTYRLPADAKKGWHVLRVKVNRPGVEVAARNGFFVGQETPAEVEKEMATALQSPFPYTALPMLVRWTGFGASRGGKTVVGFQFGLRGGALGVDVPRKNHLSFELRTLARTADLRTVSNMKREFSADLSAESMTKLIRGGFSYEGQMELPPGDYDVRFVVRDKVSGRIGSVNAPLHVP